MPELNFTCLKNRALIRVDGDEAHHFLQNLITCDMEKVDAAGAGFGALLTPQGKILFDFLIARTDEGYLLDAPRQSLADLTKRLTFYRLRAKVEIEPLDESSGVVVSWGALAAVPTPGETISDPRLAALGQRHFGQIDDIRNALVEQGGHEVEETEYTRHRVALGVPESLSDYAFQDIFPHDADMDELNGVSFSKGCYVGQEVVSRMHHRGTARKRLIQVISETALPAPGAEILADGKSIGTLGSSTSADDRHIGIGLVRLDKAQAARNKGASFSCGDTQVTLELPQWASFTWPETADET